MSDMINLAVSDIPEADRRSLENLLGCALTPEQQVVVLAFSPSRTADVAARRDVVERIRERLTSIDQFQSANGIDPAEVDAALDEALHHLGSTTS
jgi:hypothetical protein